MIMHLSTKKKVANQKKYYQNTANKLSKDITLKNALIIIKECGAILRYNIFNTIFIDLTLEDLSSGCKRPVTSVCSVR